tara:strand:- start:4352 stop:4708 length:357 start_codon:yes stop_codon:yes gene_type:complete
VSAAELFGENFPRTFGAGPVSKMVKTFLVHVLWPRAAGTGSYWWKSSLSVVVGTDLFTVRGSVTILTGTFHIDMSIMVSAEGEGEHWSQTARPSAVISGFFPTAFTLIIFIGCVSTTG